MAPGDAIKVRIFEPYEGSIFPTIQRPGADFGVQRVTDDGTINIPFVGTVQVAGLDLNQIEKKIAQQVATSGKAQDPQVIVEFVADRTHTVMVSGDVQEARAGFPARRGPRSVVDAINRAGGPSGVGGQGGTGVGANQLEVVMRRNGQIILPVAVFRPSGRSRHRPPEERRDRRSPELPASSRCWVPWSKPATSI